LQSEPVKKNAKRKRVKLIETYDDEEDFLLTHLAEVIAQNKKGQKVQLPLAKDPVDQH